MSGDQIADGGDHAVRKAVCYCGRAITVEDGRWKHADDGSTFCYPDDPRDGEMRAEPEDTPPLVVGRHPDWCKCQRVCGGDQ